MHAQRSETLSTTMATSGGARGRRGADRLRAAESANSALRPKPHEQWQLVDQYCVDCHNDAELAGELSLDSLAPDSVAANPEAFEKVVRKLRGHLMPPPKEPRPDEQQLWSFVSWVEALARPSRRRIACRERIALHRLNRKEYANAVRDLLDLADRRRRDPAAGRAGRGLRQHRDGAAGVAVVHRAVLDRGAHGGAASRRPPRCARRAARPTTLRRARSTTHIPGLPLGTRGGILAEHYFPSDGEYEINIADMAGHIWGNDMEFENTVLVTLDSKEIYRTVIGGDEHMKRYDQEPAGAFDCINATLKNIRFATTAGPHKLGVTFLRRTFAESDDRIEHVRAGRRSGARLSRELVPSRRPVQCRPA